MKKTLLIYVLLPFAMLAKAQWETINPNPPLATYKSVVHISGERYAATGGTAIMMTNNSGETWQQPALEGTHYFNCIFFVDDETGYAGGYDGALLKTTNGGIHWEPLNCGIDDELNAIYFVNPDTGYIAAEYGVVLKTTDGGINWVKKTVAGESSNLSTIKFLDTSTGYASGVNGVFWKTANGGENWTVSDLAFWHVHDLSLLDETTIIAASDDGIYKSSDGGANWSLKFRPSPAPRDWVVYRLDFVNKNIGYATGRFNEIYKTTDGGENWSAISLPADYELDGYFPGIAFESANKGIIGDNSCFYSGDLTTNTWKKFKKSFTSKDFEAVAFSNDTTVFAVGSNIIARSKNNGRTWVEIEDSNIVGIFRDVLFVSSSSGFIVGTINSPLGSVFYESVILKTTNGGDSWDIVHNAVSQLSGIHFPTSDVGYAVGNSSQMVKTTDGGTNWTSANTGIDANLSSVFFTSSSTGYTCGASGKIYKTTDGGNTWTLQNSGITNYLYDILFINDSVGYAIDSRKTLLNTTDGGNTWNKKIPSGSPMLQLYSLCFTTPNKGTIVGERGMLIETSDGGQNWEISNLPFYGEVKGVASGNQHTTIAVGSYGSIFRKYTGPEESPIDENNNGGLINILSDNADSFNVFPNPFSNSITIHGLETEQNILIQLFDISGIIVYEAKTARFSNEDIHLNTSNLKTGIYLLRITDGVNHYTKKVLKK